MYTQSILSIKICALTLVIGIALDEITTLSSLNSGILIESNPIVKNLITQGVWSYVDIVFIIVNLAMIYFYTKIITRQPKIVMLIFFTPGLIRLLVGIQNLLLILSVGSIR
jgi:hypothetical protein